MPDQLQLRGGTTAQHTSFTGASKEVTVDTTKKTAVVHDGSTVGGVPLLREDGSNSALTLGSAGTPSIKFTGDTNTGIYSPGADQVAVATNGSGRLFINATGEILAGTSISVDGNWKIQADAAAGALTGIGVNNNGGYGVYLIYDNSVRYSGAGVLRNIANSPLAFETNNTERLRITSAGLVGIGTSSPTVPLQVIGGATVTDPVIRATNSGGTQSMALMSGGLRMDGGAPIQIFQGGSEVARIDTSGRLGIGTTSPSSALEINAAAATSPFIAKINTAEAARIDSSGRLLVGTSTAGAGIGFGITLTVDSGAADSAIFKNNAGNQAQCLYLWNAATTTDNAFLAFATETTYTPRGGITYNRSGGLVVYGTTSDYRAKDISGPVQKPGATIDALKVYEGKMKGATQSRPMLIAHEVQEHAPYAVIGEKNALKKDGTPEFQQMDVSALVPLLLAEIQSLRQRVKTLEAA